MAVLEVALPSGFVVDVQALQALKTTIETIKKVESKNDDTLAIIYFDHLSTDPISLKINGFRNHLVSEQKPVPIIVYDYYDNGMYAAIGRILFTRFDIDSNQILFDFQH